MSLWTPGSSRSYIVDNWGTNPSATPGVSVIPGISGAEGSWTASGLGTLTTEVVELHINVSGGLLATVAKLHVLDIGVDPAGGSAYVSMITDILCGDSTSLTTGGAPGHSFLFPIRIPSGATVGVRVAGSHTVAGTVRVAIRAEGRLDTPWMVPVGQYSETLGISGTSGTSFTPGNAADGTWVSLGTTTRECWWWQLCHQINNGTITAEYTYIELAYGDATNKQIILRKMHAGNTGEGIGAPLNENLNVRAAYCRVPAGSTLYVRGRCNNAPDTGYQAAAVGIGG